MKLYFTADAQIDPEHSALFNQIAVDIGKPFTDIIDSISRQSELPRLKAGYLEKQGGKLHSAHLLIAFIPAIMAGYSAAFSY